jgi:hypothetical protein
VPSRQSYRNSTVYGYKGRATAPYAGTRAELQHRVRVQGQSYSTVCGYKGRATAPCTGTRPELQHRVRVQGQSNSTLSGLQPEGSCPCWHARATARLSRRHSLCGILCEAAFGLRVCAILALACPAQPDSARESWPRWPTTTTRTRRPRSRVALCHHPRHARRQTIRGTHGDRYTQLKTGNDPETRLAIVDCQEKCFFVQASLVCFSLHVLKRTQRRQIHPTAPLGPSISLVPFSLRPCLSLSLSLSDESEARTATAPPDSAHAARPSRLKTALALSLSLSLSLSPTLLSSPPLSPSLPPCLPPSLSPPTPPPSLSPPLSLPPSLPLSLPLPLSLSF